MHPDKTTYIVFHSGKAKNLKNLNLYLNFNNPNQPHSPDLLNIVPCANDNPSIPAVKFLGLYIDPCLNYNFHTNMIRKKLSNALYFMRTAEHILNTQSLTALYYSLFHTHLIYGIQLWSSCNATSINTLFKLQKRAIRIIFSLPYNGHTEPFFKRSNILPLLQLIHFFRLQFMQQYSQGHLPFIFNHTWTTNATRSDRPYLLRNHDELFIPVSRLTAFSNHPLYIMSNIWSEFANYEMKIQRVKMIFN